MSERPSSWFLEGLAEPGSPVWRTELRPLPFRVGRRPHCNLQLRAERVSGEHAELYEEDGKLWVRDLGSTNGTYLNGQKIDHQEPLEGDDLLHFADQEFRVVLFNLSRGFRTTRDLSNDERVQEWISKAGLLREAIRTGTLEIHVQPILRLPDRSVFGYEALGRARLGGELARPAELFELAQSFGEAGELSRSFRTRSLEDVDTLPRDHALFLNMHPSELDDIPQLLDSLSEARERGRGRRLVLEIHEAAVSDWTVLGDLSERLREIDIEVAYDDFGTGQDRLLALGETSPSFLKFDLRLITDLDRASTRRVEMVRRLVDMVRELEIAPLAEGVESVGVLTMCEALGFPLVQGFLLGRPAPVESFRPVP